MVAANAGQRQNAMTGAGSGTTFRPDLQASISLG
jgi:hypothetical protein